MMIRYQSALLAMGLLLPTATPRNETVTFQTRAVEVGDRCTDRNDMSMSMDVEVSLDGQPLQTMTQTQTEREEIRTTILAKYDEQVTKIQIHCAERQTSQSGPTGDVKDVSPLVGKTLIASWKEGEIDVTQLDGEPVSEELRDAVLENSRSVFEQTEGEFAKILPDRPIEIGEEIVVDAETAREFLGGQEESPLDDFEMTLTLAGRQKYEGHDCARFEVELKMSGEAEEGVLMAAALEGELLLGIETSWPHLLRLEGELEIEGGQPLGDQVLAFSGLGPMKMERHAVYEKVK